MHTHVSSINPSTKLNPGPVQELYQEKEAETDNVRDGLCK